MNEQWLNVPGFENYEASNHGNFRRRILKGFHELRGKIDPLGYQQIGLVRSGKQYWFLAHRLIALMFLNVPKHPTGFLTVNHKNRKRSDNRSENLELITVAENNRHWRKHPLEQLEQELRAALEADTKSKLSKDVISPGMVP